MPAIEIYDGVFYRILKRAFQNDIELKNKLDIYILSAKYGIISTTFPILPYDLKMTKEISKNLLQDNTSRLSKIVLESSPNKIVSVMGKTYRESIDWTKMPVRSEFISGEIGIMQSKFKNWLLAL